jgi:uncharacterized repeat protein (TIGR03847 family)
MASPSFDLVPVSRITVGTVGPPGQRTFYLQARRERSLVSLIVEKVQLQALSERLLEVLPEAPAAVELDVDQLRLEEPLEAAWRVGELEVSYERARDACLLLAREQVEDEAEGATARFGATSLQMRALARLALQLCKAGRPLCALCGRPKDPAGHACPQRNGKRPAATLV